MTCERDSEAGTSLSTPPASLSEVHCPRCKSWMDDNQFYGPCDDCRYELTNKAEQRAAWRNFLRCALVPLRGDE